VAAALGDRGLDLSPEADAAATTFAAAAARGEVAAWVAGAVSGRELGAGASPADVALAAAVDADDVVPRLHPDGWLRPG
jgi:hypothetical protein